MVNENGVWKKSTARWALLLWSSLLVAFLVACATNHGAKSPAQASPVPPPAQASPAPPDPYDETNFWLALKKYPGFREFNINIHPAFVILPPAGQARPTRDWVMFAPTFYRHSPNAAHFWLFDRLLEQGIAIAGIDIGESFGNPQGRALCNDLYLFMTDKIGLARQVTLLPQSRGGLMLYNWAAEHPEQVRCIAGIYPVGDLASYPTIAGACRAYGMNEQELTAQLSQHNPIDRLEPLVRAGVPILHVHGDTDQPVPLEKNSGELVKRYQALGGTARLIVPKGHGHEVTDVFFQNQEMLDFILNPPARKPKS